MLKLASFLLYRDSQFYWWGKLDKTTDLRHISDKLDHIMLHRVYPLWAGFELTTLVMISTDCIDSCKIQLPYDHNHDGPCDNYHTITTTTAPVTTTIQSQPRRPQNLMLFVLVKVILCIKHFLSERIFFNFVAEPNYPKFNITIVSKNGDILLILELPLKILLIHVNFRP